MEQIARTLHEAREAKAEAKALAKYKDRLNPPRPVGSTNNISAPKIKTKADLIASLDADLGDDWG